MRTPRASGVDSDVMFTTTNNERVSGMFTVTIETDNAAFDNPGDELARILRKLAERVGDVDGRHDSGKVMDVNGNSIGEWRWMP